MVTKVAPSSCTIRTTVTMVSWEAVKKSFKTSRLDKKLQPKPLKPFEESLQRNS